MATGTWGGGTDSNAATSHSTSRSSLYTWVDSRKVRAAFLWFLTTWPSSWSRNVQQTEVGGLAPAWGNVKARIVEGPRLSKAGLRAEKVKNAVPELYKDKSAVEPLPTFVLVAAPGKLYHEIKKFGSHPMRTMVTTVDGVPLEGPSVKKTSSYWSTMESAVAEGVRTFSGNAWDV